MESDQLTVVNEADQPIGTASRTEVHEKGLLHRAVHILVFNNKGELFLQLRSLSKDRHPNVWDSSASGHVDAGEDYLDAAYRELSEELEIPACIQLTPLFKLPASKHTDNEFVQVYKCTWDGAIQLNPREITIGQWFPLYLIEVLVREAPKMFAPSFLSIWFALNRSHPANKSMD